MIQECFVFIIVSILIEMTIIDQYEYGIEQFAKNKQGKWVLTEYKKQEETLQLESLSWEIPLREIYERVDFSQLQEKNNNPEKKIED